MLVAVPICMMFAFVGVLMFQHPATCEGKPRRSGVPGCPGDGGGDMGYYTHHHPRMFSRIDPNHRLRTAVSWNRVALPGPGTCRTSLLGHLLGPTWSGVWARAQGWGDPN